MDYFKRILIGRINRTGRVHKDCVQRRLESVCDLFVCHLMYLEICVDYIDIFLSPQHDLQERIVKVAKVFFFSTFGNCGQDMVITE